MKPSVCLLCESSDVKPLLTGRDRLMGLPGEFTVLQCRNCGLKFTDPGSITTDLMAYYPENYSPYKTCGSGEPKAGQSLKRRIKQAIKNSPAGPLLAALAAIDDPPCPELPRGAAVLEIGCASGNFLAGLKSKGWNLHGVELSDFASDKARNRGLDVFSGTLEQAKFPDDHFSAVFAFHVMEHLPDPLATLREINRITVKGGYFIFSLPNADCWEFKVFKNRWYALDLPRHLFHFGPETITKTLERAGFKTEHIYFQNNFNNIFGSLAYLTEDVFGANFLSRYLRNIPKTSGMLLKTALLPLTAILSKLGQSGRLTIVASK
jgi:SAM-dependent methyltransferase